MKTRVVQKAVILDKNKRLLVVRRSKTDPRRPLQWDLPGGLREINEDLLVSIGREVFEETGLVAENFMPVYSKTEIRTWTDGKEQHTDNVVFIYYMAFVRSTSVKLSFEHDRFSWNTLEDSIKSIEYQIQKDALVYIRDNSLLEEPIALKPLTLIQ